MFVWGEDVRRFWNDKQQNKKTIWIHILLPFLDIFLYIESPNLSALYDKYLKRKCFVASVLWVIVVVNLLTFA